MSTVLKKALGIESPSKVMEEKCNSFFHPNIGFPTQVARNPADFLPEILGKPVENNDQNDAKID